MVISQSAENVFREWNKGDKPESRLLGIGNNNEGPLHCLTDAVA